MIYLELYHEILIHLLSAHRAEILFPDLDSSLEALARDACCQTLARICAIVRDDTLSDPTCFAKIEAIVQALEQAGLDPGARHDFG